MARAQLDEGRPEAALNILRQTQRDFPTDAGTQNLLGLTHLALRNSPRAIRHFTMAYKLDKQPGTALNLSSAYIDSGDYDKATRLLLALVKTKELKGYKHKERVFHNLGYAAERQGNNAKAENWFQEAIDENPTYFPAHLELARLYEKTKRPALAAQTYRRATDYCLLCFEPVYSLSMLLVKMGRPIDARKAVLRFTSNDSIAPADRARAQQLLRLVTVAGLPPRKKTVAVQQQETPASRVVNGTVGKTLGSKQSPAAALVSPAPTSPAKVKR